MRPEYVDIIYTPNKIVYKVVWPIDVMLVFGNDVLDYLDYYIQGVDQIAWDYGQVELMWAASYGEEDDSRVLDRRLMASWRMAKNLTAEMDRP